MLLQLFWENHKPNQGNRQGNDVGDTYRSGIFYTNESQREQAEASRVAYQKVLTKAGHDDPITTEITEAGPFYFAEAAVATKALTFSKLRVNTS